MSKAAKVLEKAERTAQSVETWADLSNALFDPIDGLIAKAYPTRAEREAFIQTDEYKKIRQLLTSAIHRHGLVEGATPKKSGRFVVRLPQSLHAALQREAGLEGVSLNQLVVAKLAARLRDVVCAEVRLDSAAGERAAGRRTRVYESDAYNFRLLRRSRRVTQG